MPPSLLFDIDKIDLTQQLFTRKEIYERLPQAYEFEQLDGICYVNESDQTGVAYRDVRADEWWCRGHIPGNPIFPGVLQLESAAQVCAFFSRYLPREEGFFFGFGGVDRCKFRNAVIPPARIYYLCKKVKDQPRRVVCETQGVLDGAVIFEALITGLVMKEFS